MVNSSQQQAKSRLETGLTVSILYVTVIRENTVIGAAYGVPGLLWLRVQGYSKIMVGTRSGRNSWPIKQPERESNSLICLLHFIQSDPLLGNGCIHNQERPSHINEHRTVSLTEQEGKFNADNPPQVCPSLRQS